jgi:hypothetical protein
MTGSTELVHDPRAVRLGRQPQPPDGRDLRLAAYLDTTVLPPVPDPVDVTQGLTSWGMLMNDQLGDCTIASALHMEMIWARDSGKGDYVPTDDQALAGYEAACGYVDGDPDTDRGGIERNVLKYWKKKGLGGREVSAFVAVDPKSVDEMQAALYLFDGVYLGVLLEKVQQTQSVWDYAPGSGPWGGHAVPLVGWNKAAGTGTVVTWGQTKDVTESFIAQQCEEAWAVLSTNMLDGNNSGPAGLDLTTLRTDLRKLHVIP